jgi:hypothetical protein
VVMTPAHTTRWCDLAWSEKRIPGTELFYLLRSMLLRRQTDCLPFCKHTQYDEVLGSGEVACTTCESHQL